MQLCEPPYEIGVYDFGSIDGCFFPAKVDAYLGIRSKSTVNNVLI